MCTIRENDQKWNHIDTLITKNACTKDKKININITKEQNGIINYIHGTRHHITIIR
jgi:hypothetical protein